MTKRKTYPEGQDRWSSHREAVRRRFEKPEHKAKMSALMKERVASDSFKAHCGQLTSSEYAEVVKSIKAGKKYMDIALDWLISEDRVQEIASREGIFKFKGGRQKGPQ